ncbi:MAG: 6-hydroxymethylpterin diphosphokinase MptE-like protein [Caldilineaceae bacterium]
MPPIATPRKQARIWQANIAALSPIQDASRVFSPMLHSRIRTASTPSGLDTLWVEHKPAARLVHSGREPQAEAMYWVDNAVGDDWQVAIVFGFGLGYHIEEMVRRYPDRVVIVVEPDKQIFETALQHRVLNDLLRLPNLYLCVGGSAEQTAKTVFDHLRGNLQMGKPALFAWPYHNRTHGDYWQAVQRFVAEHANQDVVNMLTYRSLSYQWVSNFFANLRASVEDPGVPSLRSIFAGRPAILVAAGPSLDKNVAQLAKVQGRAVIVAVLQAVRALQRHGIQPDLVVSLDPKDINYERHYQGLETSDFALAYAPIVNRRIVAEHPGLRFVMGTDIYPFSHWMYEAVGEPKGRVLSGPSVANLSWDLLRQLGCDPIVFVGQDLAFTGNKSHADDVTGGGVIRPEMVAEVTANPQNYTWVDGVEGKKLLTNKSMYAMKIWFEQRIAELGNSRRIIDATEGGAYIEGTELLSLADAIDEICGETFDPAQALVPLHQAEQARLRNASTPARMLVLVERVLDELGEIERIAQEAARPLRKLVDQANKGAVSPSKYESLYRKVRGFDRAMHELETSKYVVAPTIHHQIQAVNIVANRFLKETDLSAKSRLLADVYLPLFQAATEAAGVIRAYVEEARADFGPD